VIEEKGTDEHIERERERRVRNEEESLAYYIPFPSASRKTLLEVNVRLAPVCSLDYYVKPGIIPKPK
jgi:hypothetical protein